MDDIKVAEIGKSAAEGLYLGLEVKEKNPIIFDLYNRDKSNNFFVFGMTGTGMNFSNKLRILKTIEIQNIVNAHLNNNNWLKMHNRPMVRKGHPFYKESKKYKGLKPFKIDIMGPGEEYKAIASKYTSDVIKFTDDRTERLQIKNI